MNCYFEFLLMLLISRIFFAVSHFQNSGNVNVWFEQEGRTANFNVCNDGGYMSNMAQSYGGMVFSASLWGNLFISFYKLWGKNLKFWDYLLSSLLPSTNFSSNIWLLLWPLIIYIKKNVFKILSVSYRKLWKRGINQFHEIFYSKSFQTIFRRWRNQHGLVGWYDRMWRRM